MFRRPVALRLAGRYSAEVKLYHVVLSVHRFGRFASGSVPLNVIYRALDLVVVKVLLGADVPAGVMIGDRVRLEHGAKGLVVHETVVISDDVKVFHNVTLTRGVHIGPGARIGTGAVLLPDVHIGAGARVGANAVVNSDVPAGATAVGVPARVLPQ